MDKLACALYGAASAPTNGVYVVDAPHWRCSAGIARQHTRHAIKPIRLGVCIPNPGIRFTFTASVCAAQIHSRTRSNKQYWFCARQRSLPELIEQHNDRHGWLRPMYYYFCSLCEPRRAADSVTAQWNLAHSLTHACSGVKACKIIRRN